MIPLFLAICGAVASLGAVSAASSAVAVAVPLGLLKKNKEGERNSRLGIDTEYMKDKTAEAGERLKNGQFAQPPQYSDFEEYELEDGILPEKMSYLPKKWILTQSEMVMLLSMIRKQMQLLGQGSYADETKALCSKYNIPWSELTQHSHELAISTDFDKLIWLSNNRSSDFFIKQKLDEQKSAENG